MRDYINLLVKVGVGAITGAGVGFIFASCFSIPLFCLLFSVYIVSVSYYPWQHEDGPIPFRFLLSLFGIFTIPPGMLYGAMFYPLLKSMEVPLIRRIAVVSSVGLVVGILEMWVRGIIGGELVVLLPNLVTGLLVGTVYSSVIGILAYGDTLYLQRIKQRLLQNLLRGVMTGLGFASGITLIEAILLEGVANFLLVPNMVMGLSGGILFWLLDRQVTERLDHGLMRFIHLFPSPLPGLLALLFVGGVVSSPIFIFIPMYMSWPARAKMVLPDTEIVFQTQLESDGVGSIGFVNSDGTGLQIIPLPTESGRGVVVTPVRTSDRAYLAFYKTIRFDPYYYVEPDLVDQNGESPHDWQTDEPSGRVEIVDTSGYITQFGDIWSEGKIAPIIGTHQVVDNNDIINLDNGEPVTTTDLPLGWYIGTNAMVGSQFVYIGLTDFVTETHSINYGEPQTHNLMLYHIDSQQKEILLSSPVGIRYPALSPDGKWVAYTYNRAIYRLNLTTRENQRLVTVTTCYNLPISAPSWSPDGQWLVYHHQARDITTCEDGLQHTAIYKYHLATGQETKLVDGGVNPYWSHMKTK